MFKPGFAYFIFSLVVYSISPKSAWCLLIPVPIIAADKIGSRVSQTFLRTGNKAILKQIKLCGTKQKYVDYNQHCQQYIEEQCELHVDHKPLIFLGKHAKLILFGQTGSLSLFLIVCMYVRV